MSERSQIPTKAAAAPARRLTSAPAGLLQRKCSCGGSGGSDAECTECKKKKLQRRAAGDGPETAPPIVHDVLRSPGRPLDAQTRAYFEPRFGHDFSRVRVHTDAEAAESAHAVNALAYTVGPQIVFRMGQYRPGDASGRRLLAHELTHVVQQRGQPPVGGPLRVEPVSDSHEQEAERASVVANDERAVESVRSSSGRVQRQASGGNTVSSGAGPDGGTTGGTGGTPKPETCAAPKDLDCPPTKAAVKGASKKIQFSVDKSDLDKHALAEIDAAAKSWHAGGGKGIVRIDGYASSEYDCVYNWRLSCRRAKAAEAELERPSDGSPGVPASNISIFAHGESDEAGAALAPNRVATITLPTTAPTPQPEPVPTPKPKPVPPTPTPATAPQDLTCSVQPVRDECDAATGKCATAAAHCKDRFPNPADLDGYIAGIKANFASSDFGPNAKRNFGHWLDGAGTELVMPTSLFEGHKATNATLLCHRGKILEGVRKRINDGRITPGVLSEMIPYTGHGNAFSFSSPHSDDLAWSVGGFQICSNARVMVTKTAPDRAKVQFIEWKSQAYDCYNWDPGKGVAIQDMDDATLCCVENAGKAKHFVDRTNPWDNKDAASTEVADLELGTPVSLKACDALDGTR